MVFRDDNSRPKRSFERGCLDNDGVAWNVPDMDADPDRFALCREPEAYRHPLDLTATW
jgi:hypothetical protein